MLSRYQNILERGGPENRNSCYRDLKRHCISGCPETFAGHWRSNAVLNQQRWRTSEAWPLRRFRFHSQNSVIGRQVSDPKVPTAITSSLPVEEVYTDPRKPEPENADNSPVREEGVSEVKYTSSPSPPSDSQRIPPPKPPRMRSLTASDDRQVPLEHRDQTQDWEPEMMSSSSQAADAIIAFSSIDDATLLPSTRSQLPERRSSRHPSLNFDFRSAAVLISKAVELIDTSGVQPEVVADFLRRRDVVNDDTVAGVRQCATKRSAVELIAEVVVSKGRPEALLLYEAVRSATGSCRSHVADCLEAVDGLLAVMSAIGVCDRNDVKSEERGCLSTRYIHPCSTHIGELMNF